ncbi:thiamine pyrophosphate-dependent dehydrogenase E1 component subunit alpha [Halalkalibacterium halodurans]|jgi:2-oxoisovalerate dehydrogenase E1 component alpha subunit|uniref:2-oxoisovalerate dehydrogenase subunit alpha n=2 Tax=Halalkalibacterium halodurans TaxID=86665 RepID=Q9K987_HALH5|nr:thiamine pyrophosphate-dependent dehydrogenase E1 component subunit alpha [Halalkalibacterium halodurans]MDY7223314.1 thiamine pyrophosphate-dependent dehydrogenase E1 component subunit alpha [Halalkalibacterium halodurans]MDY7242535.1 thiamine pyrophosphate-dependent dehydrogenase E1 component subunit alpha [Halalkalibacterium halodurans]MED3647949.1 thiamine pyrophosphate-dependent dehydrogenase E1 component subunit alpha [Halalkalibacterium halodurans]MED4080250.1 thiamine pyrophosphate-d
MTEPRHKQLGLSDETVVHMYETMLLARKIDERMWLLNRAGKIPFVISCQGQEAAQVGAAFALDRTKDYILPYYRDMGVVLTFGMTAKDLMLSGFAKAEDPNSGGRQMPGHFGSKKLRIVTGSSPVTTQVPHAVGIALAGKMKGEDFITFTTFGEGSSNQGDFHEGANFAGVHKLPVIFMCENNKYAISVPIEKQLACEKVSDRAIGYGMPGVTVDGNDPLAVYEAVKQAADRARRGEGPSLIETVSYRLTPHSSDDDDRAYRSREEVEEAKKYDALITFAEYLLETGALTEEGKEAMDKRVSDMVNEATEYAERAPYADPEQALGHVYAE